MITPQQIRAARAFLNLGQQDAAAAVGVSKANISDIENGRGEPKGATLVQLQKFFEMSGVEFKDGGILPARNIVHIYEGTDCYLRMLDDVHQTLSNGGELLKSAANERRSSEAVIQKTRELRADKIKMRTLVQSGDTYLMGALKEYRWMPPELYIDGDVKVIYGDRVGYLVAWLDTPRTIIIQDKTIAEEQRRYFEFAWQHSETPSESTAPVRFE